METAIGLAACGVAELVLCLYGAHAQNHHRITTAYAAALAQAVPYALAAWLTLRNAPGRRAFWLVVVFAAAFRIVAFFGTTPYLSSDVYRYVWDGRVQGQASIRIVTCHPTRCWGTCATRRSMHA